MVTDRRIVSANEGRRLQRHGSHMCAFPRVKKRKKWTKWLGGHACSDRALGLFRTFEEPRSIVQSRTIERGVLGTICGRRHGHRERPSNWTRGRGARARRSHRREGMPAIARGDAARFVSLPRDSARLSGSTASPEIASDAARTGGGKTLHSTSAYAIPALLVRLSGLSSLSDLVSSVVFGPKILLLRFFLVGPAQLQHYRRFLVGW